MSQGAELEAWLDDRSCRACRKAQWAWFPNQRVATTCAPITRVSASRNFVLFARRDGDVAVPGASHFWFEGAVGSALLPSLSVPGAWSRLTPCSEELALRDDRNPIDELQMQSLEQARARLAGR